MHARSSLFVAIAISILFIVLILYILLHKFLKVQIRKNPIKYMKKRNKSRIELEIHEHFDADFYPTICPSCYTSDLRRYIHKVRFI